VGFGGALIDDLIIGGGGVHFFVARNFSLDALGLFKYAVGNDTSENGDKSEAIVNTFDINLLAGISGWF
jgi:hypothetical protein